MSAILIGRNKDKERMSNGGLKTRNKEYNDERVTALILENPLFIRFPFFETKQNNTDS